MPNNKTTNQEVKKTIEEKTQELEDTRLALMNMLEDVEEARKAAEAEKNKTLAIINNLADGLLMLDESGRISLVNPQVEKFLKIKARDIIGFRISGLEGFSKLKSLVDLLTEAKKKIFRKELSLRDNLVVEVTTLPITSGDQKIGTLIILHDVTREKTVEKLKTEFVSLSAHQLRTPLSAIKWTLKMILDGDLGKITKEQREYLEKTYLSNERMINLINDLLNVTRIEEGKYLFRPQSVDLCEAVQDVVDSYQDPIKQRKISFQFKNPNNSLPKVNADEEKIKLVIQNLIDNAISYTPQGGKVVASLKETDGKIEFSVKDTGIGIEKSQQNRVFSKFFRTRNATRVKTRGTGLGLYIAKNIIAAHNGKIWFESEKGKGSTFYFTLPVEKSSKQE